MVKIVMSVSAAARLAAVERFLDSYPPSTEILIAGASRGSADDLVRAIARHRGASFGLTRFSVTELAARSAASTMAREARAPASQAAVEAMAARVVFEASAANELSYFDPVARMPGFPRALARTLYELRLAGVTSGHWQVRADAFPEASAAADLGRLLARMEAQLTTASVADRAALFHAATEAWRRGEAPWVGMPVVLLDPAIDTKTEQEFVAALLDRAPAVLATVPDGDSRTLAALAGGPVDVIRDPAPVDSDLAHLRRYVFTSDRPSLRARAGDVCLFSAPGEGREAVEIVRRALDEASRGVPFDEMAIFLRAPAQYLGLVEHACARAKIPVYFDKGTRRPDPAGRAFVALLSCAVEGLSAKRFDEYLSLGQVPRLERDAIGPGDARAIPFAAIGSRDELLADRNDAPDPDDPETAVPDPPLADSDDDAIVAGTLRSPWKWEELIVESAVVGGRTRQDGERRWQRRLDGLAADYRLRLDELRRDEPDSPRIARYERDLRDLSHLRAFALPIVRQLASWPERSAWRDWLAKMSSLAERALSRPTRVLQTLADLAPMGDIGEVSLEEVRDALHERLVTLDWDPPLRRYGRLFVGTPHQARGRSFRVVFVPGLAERVVPQRPREDPLLLDEGRRSIDRGLVRQEDRGNAERLLLKIAIGAASERLYLSYPRMDVAETRARVPSFYALDVMRAITGRVPDHRVLAQQAAEEAGASLAWPAPRDPSNAIDDLEHDLSVLRILLDTKDPAAAKGRAQYLLELNETLRRSVRSRFARARPAWSVSDGLTRVAPTTSAALGHHRLGRRAYSLSALQRFSTCPYQFLLSTIHRLEPWDEPEPLVRMDPLTRGSLFHKVQAEFYRALDAKAALPVTAATVGAAIRTLDQVLERVAGEYEETLAPAIERVWHDEVGEIRRDLGIWVRRLASETTWVPAFFEFSFGLNDAGRDPRSLPDAVTVDGRFILRGSVDLIEHDRSRDVYRITDHKTGKNRSNPDLIVGGGAVLQPVLYGAAIEQGTGKKVVEGRLFYCTTAGGFGVHAIPLDDYQRRQGLQVLEIVDRAVERGFLVAAPNDGACRWCDFRAVCGPHEEERVGIKKRDRLADLEALRSMR